MSIRDSAALFKFAQGIYVAKYMPALVTCVILRRWACHSLL